MKKGYIQKEIHDSAYTYQREIEREERAVVGVNRFQVQEEKPTNLLRVDPSVRLSQIERLNLLKAERDHGRVVNSLAELKRVAEGDGNLMIPISDAVKTYATLGEICDVLREVFGEYRQITTFG